MSPYLLTAPALISFSGGRTSAYMLHEIVKAHGGQLPEGVFACFANTGKEREETLRFVHECGSRWGVRIHWLERIYEAPGFEEVGFNSASRNGEPFERVIARRGFLPNSVARFCTIELKIRAMRDFMKTQGLGRWVNAVGLRADEQRRILKGIARDAAGKDPWRSIWPLNTAGVSKADVLAFWARQDFDLGLMGVEGNCDLCFLKGKRKLKGLMLRRPDLAAWWIEQESRIGGSGKTTGDGARFRQRHSYAELLAAVRAQGDLFADPLDDDGDDYDAECGASCNADLDDPDFDPEEAAA